MDKVVGTSGEFGYGSVHCFAMEWAQDTEPEKHSWLRTVSVIKHHSSASTKESHMHRVIELKSSRTGHEFKSSTLLHNAGMSIYTADAFCFLFFVVWVFFFF